MPIEIKAVSKAEYAAWLNMAKQEFAMDMPVVTDEAMKFASAN
jgi:heme/copper-type cytochrome/quinol oxidase subunit 2